jgi:hypothetical protein
MRVVSSTLLAMLISLSLAGAARATAIERSVVINLETDGRVIPFDRPAWEGIVGVDEFSFSTGDQLKLNIQFANQQHLELTDLGNGIQGGLELTKL